MSIGLPISSSQNSAASGTAVSVTAPAGIVAGMLALVLVTCNGARTIVDNNGSTPFTEDLNDYQDTVGGATVSVFTRLIKAGDPGTYNFTTGGTDRWGVIAAALPSPAVGASFWDVAPVTGNSANGAGAAVTTADSKTVTTIQANALHCIACLPDNPGTTSVQPAGYIIIQNIVANQQMCLAMKSIGSPQIIPAKTWTWTTASDWITLSFALQSSGFTLPNQKTRPRPYAPGMPR